MAPLFKNTALQEKLSVSVVPRFEEKIEVVKQWNRALQDKSLLKKTETQCEQAFNDDFFINILGYTRFPSDRYTIEPKAASETAGGQKPDAALGIFTSENKAVHCVCETKDANTSLDKPQQREGNLTPVQQGFKYKPLYRNCGFVIVTNFREIRLYRDTMHDYERFTLEELADPTDDYRNFRKFHYLLCADHLIAESGKSKTEQMLAAIRIEQEEITKQFYKKYRLLRQDVIRSIVTGNKISKQHFPHIVEKAQKIMDRIVFICFCEDLGLLPENKLQEVVRYAEQSPVSTSIWNTLKGFFTAIDKGSPKLEIPDGYNGELFKEDVELNALEVDDEVCKKLAELGRYDFAEDLSVNILGHIFEQSINDIEELKRIGSLEETEESSKRKKEGIYYTPEYIVDFIVSSTLGKHLEELEAEILKRHGLKEDVTGKNYEKRATSAYQEYLDAISRITVLDLACGSGAFLVKVFDYLKKEHERVAQILEELTGVHTSTATSGMVKTLLHENIYGVDLNAESVEITKLSLWLKTAQKGKKLEELKGNIKCGNSLTDDPAVSDKAFVWEKEFADILKNGGFDVVVGNPPYVGEKGNKETFRPIKETEWGKNFYHGKMDLFYFFFHRGLDLLKDGGRLGFITTNYFVTAYGGRKLRKDFKERTVIEHIANFNEVKIFEDAKGQHNMITILRKDQKASEKAEIVNFYDKHVPLAEVLNIGSADREGAEVSHVEQKDLYDGEENYIRISASESREGDAQLHHILDKMKQQGTPLVELCDISNGMHTQADYLSEKKYPLRDDNSAEVGDGIYVLDEENSNDLKILTDLRKSKESKYLKPFYKNSDIEKYTCTEKTAKYVIYINKQTDCIEELPIIHSHLKRFKEIIEAASDNAPYLHRPKREDFFANPKVITPHRSKWCTFAYTEQSWYASADVYFIIEKDQSISLKYILAALNSGVIFLWLQNRGKRKGDIMEIYQKPLSEIPIKKISENEQKSFIEKVDAMIHLHKELIEKSNKFSAIITSEYGLETWPTKLERFWELSFDDFLKALKLKILPLQKRQDLMEYFEKHKAELSKLAETIDSLQREIDEMVCDVYGLTEVEKEIVLQSVS